MAESALRPLMTLREGLAIVKEGGFSPDGLCGPAHGNTICNPNSNIYTGGCCSVCWMGKIS